MMGWGGGWIYTIRATEGVCHGGGVSSVVCDLMYQDLDALKLGDYVMFFPRR